MTAPIYGNNPVFAIGSTTSEMELANSLRDNLGWMGADSDAKEFLIALKRALSEILEKSVFYLTDSEVIMKAKASKSNYPETQLPRRESLDLHEHLKEDNPLMIEAYGLIYGFDCCFHSSIHSYMSRLTDFTVERKKLKAMDVFVKYGVKLPTPTLFVYKLAGSEFTLDIKYVLEILKRYTPDDKKEILHSVVYFPNVDISLIHAIISSGSDPNFISKDGASHALHAMVVWNNAELAKVLLDYGTDANSPDPAGIRPLHKVKSVKMMNVLLEAGASPLFPDVEGRIPRDYYLPGSEIRSALEEAARTKKLA